MWHVDDLRKTLSNLTLQPSCSSTILFFQMSGLHAANSKCLDNKSTLDNTISTNRGKKPNPWPSQFLFYQELSSIQLRRLPDLISHFIFHR